MPKPIWSWIAAVRTLNIHIGYDDQRDGFDESLTLEMARSLSQRLIGLLDQLDRMSRAGICEE